jgi:hypothetical protein
LTNTWPTTFKSLAYIQITDTKNAMRTATIIAPRQYPKSTLFLEKYLR